MKRWTRSRRSGLRRCVSLYSVTRRMRLMVRLCRQYEQRRESWRLDCANPLKSGILQPDANFVEREGVALVGVHQHVDGEDQGRNGRLALGIDQNFRDCDRAARRKRLEGLLEQPAATLLTL